MWIWAIAATLLSIALAITFTAYRRQVKNTCRHLAFMEKNKTNLRLRGELDFKELNELADSVNRLLDNSDKLKREVLQSGQELKDAITSISHDIRTPLTSLDGYFHLLSEAQTDEERSKYISVIRGRIDVLGSMLEELFTYTKLQNEQYSITLSEIDIKKCVLDTLFSFYNDIEERGITPEVDICEERVSTIGNTEAMGRIVQNIVKNALEHGSGELRISFGRSDGNVVFVCENSVDSPESIDISQVFRRFYRSDEARTKSSTGLGLAIARGLAEKQGGTLTADLDGNMFRITAAFPLT